MSQEKYRVTLDITIENTLESRPDRWDWDQLLDLASQNSVNLISCKHIDEPQPTEPKCPRHKRPAKTCQYCQFLKTGKRIIADFQAEAWQRDYAVPVDPEGDREWNATAYLFKINTDGDEQEYSLDSIEDGTLPRDAFNYGDYFRSDPAAPWWVQEWDGPFTINIRVEEK